MLLQLKQDLNGISIVKKVESNPLLPPKTLREASNAEAGCELQYSLLTGFRR